MIAIVNQGGAFLYDCKFSRGQKREIHHWKFKEIFLAYLDFKKNKEHRISPVNKESCRKQLQEKPGRTVHSEDILF